MIHLADLQACFEGVIPSIVATAAKDGTPNISYLSQVVMVDADHIGLSNQFFSKTAANIRENRHAAVQVVDARNGELYQLDVTFVESRGTGGAFDHVKSHIDATSAQVGMAGIFKLRTLDVYRVHEVARIASAAPVIEAPEPSASRLHDAAQVVESIAAQMDIEHIVDAALDGLRTHFGYQHMLLLTLDPARHVLTTIASRGYERAGIGSEVPPGGGVASLAAEQMTVIRVSDLSRVQRFIAAVRDSSEDENRTRTIALPGMPEAMSQIAVPLVAQGQVQGVLFAESPSRLAFTKEDEVALTIVARQMAAALVLAETLAGEPQDSAHAQQRRSPADRTFHVTHHAFDHSVFIGNEYIIKGVPGRLLIFFLDAYLREGRREFTNREMRLANALRLPDVKDNLETRLLLLRRRLEEKGAPVRLARAGRGRIALQMHGEPVLEQLRN